MTTFKSAFIALWNKVAKFDKGLKVYEYGDSNSYPSFVKKLTAESVTASQCSELMADYLIGKGFGPKFNKILVNKKEGTTLLQFGAEIAESITDNRGVAIHVNYDLNFEISSAEVLPWEDCRIGKKDDNDYSGFIHVCHDWTDGTVAKKAQQIHVFNPNKRTVKSQIMKAAKKKGDSIEEAIRHYKGQVFYFVLGKDIYPLARIHPVLEDCGSERQAAIYKHISLTKGWFGKTAVITKPMVDDTLADAEGDSGKLYQRQVSERKKFRETLKDFIGAENADGILHLEIELEGDNLEEEILFKNIEGNINDKLFAHTEKSVKDNIRSRYKNAPAILVITSDGSIFGKSGESIVQAKIFYQDQTEKERMLVQELVNKIMKKHAKSPGEELQIVPLIEKQTSKKPKE